MPKKRKKTLLCECGKFNFNSHQSFSNHKKQCTIYLESLPDPPTKKNKTNQQSTLNVNNSLPVRVDNGDMMSNKINNPMIVEQQNQQITPSVNLEKEVDFVSVIFDKRTEMATSLIEHTLHEIENLPVPTISFSEFNPAKKIESVEISVIKEVVISKILVEFSKTCVQWYVDKNPCDIKMHVEGSVRVCSCGFRCSSKVDFQAHLHSSHFGFLICHICEQGNFKNVGTLKRHVNKFHNVHVGVPVTETVPTLPQQFHLQNMLSKEDESAFDLIDLSLRVVDSPFRSSYLKIDLKYFTKDL